MLISSLPEIFSTQVIRIRVINKTYTVEPSRFAWTPVVSRGRGRAYAAATRQARRARRDVFIAIAEYWAVGTREFASIARGGVVKTGR